MRFLLAFLSLISGCFIYGLSASSQSDIKKNNVDLITQESEKILIQTQRNRSNSRNNRNHKSHGSRIEISQNPKLLAESYQLQRSAMSLGFDELHKPVILKIGSHRNSGKITGNIKINGRLIQSLSRSQTRVDLSKYIHRGKNTIEIIGVYYPGNSDIEISVESDLSKMVQETSGNGKLNQMIVLNVN